MTFLRKVTNASKRSICRFVAVTLSVLLATGSIWYNQQHADAVRFIDRSLFIYSPVAGETTTYRVSFKYPTVNNVGSLRLLFCDEAIAYLPCDPPVGLDASAAVLAAQTVETGFTISSQTANSIVLSRPAVPTATVVRSSYTFSNIVNPTGAPRTFYIRLNSFASTNATGPFIDYGSIASSTTMQLGLSTQVPPVLIFCTGKTIPTDCEDPQGPYIEDFEDPPTAEDPLYTSSQMYAYTNARSGYVITLSGRTMTSGIYEIPPITDAPEISLPGKGQFGINLTANTAPLVGANPSGSATNTVLNTDYTQVNEFLFGDGDVLVTSDGVTLDRKFTISYIVNVPPDQRPGVYNTTVTFICTGNF